MSQAELVGMLNNHYSKYPVSRESLGNIIDAVGQLMTVVRIHGKHHGTPRKHHHQLIKDWLFMHDHQNVHQELQKSVWYFIKWYIKCIRYCRKVCQSLHLLQNHLRQVHTNHHWWYTLVWKACFGHSNSFIHWKLEIIQCIWVNTEFGF